MLTIYRLFNLNLLLSGAFFLAISSSASASHDLNDASDGRMSGVVEQIVCGEIDPFAIGDACLITVRHDDDSTSLLVAGDEAYANLSVDQLYALEGQQLRIGHEDLAALEQDALSVLETLVDEALVAYWWNGQTALFSTSMLTASW